jgi:hypothetical protein
VDGDEREVAAEKKSEVSCGRVGNDGRPSDASDVRLEALPKPKSQNLPPVDGGRPNGPT